MADSHDSPEHCCGESPTAWPSVKKKSTNSESNLRDKHESRTANVLA